MAIKTIYTESIQQLYVAYFSRPADNAGLAYWETVVAAANGDTTAISTAFSTSAEYLAIYGSLNNTAKVTAVYQNEFGRAPEPGGLAFYVNLLDLGKISISQMVTTIARGAQGTDKIAYDSKVNGAIDFTMALDTTAEITAYASGVSNGTAINWLAGITSVETLITQQAQLPTVTAAIAAGGTGVTTTFTLTTGADNFVGGTGNNTFNGTENGTTATSADTLNAADTIKGGTGTNVLNITGTATNTDVTNGAAISNIQTVNIRETAGTGTLNASSIAGLTAVNANLASGVVTVTNLAAGASAGIIGNGTIVTGALNASYVDAATAAILNLVGGVNGGAVVISGVGLTSTTINSTGAANTIGTLTAPVSSTSTLTVNAATNLTTGAITTSAKQITATGAATNITLGAITDANLTTINASGMTAGGITVDLLSTITSFVGGQGSDVVTTVGGSLGATAVIAAGTGTDTLKIITTAITTTLDGAKYTGFETLSVGVSAQQDVSLLAGITSEILSVSGAGLKNLTAAQAAAVTVQVTNAGSIIALTTATGTSDVLGLTLQNATVAAAATPINFTTATITGFETLNVAVNSGISTAITSAAAAGSDQISFTAAANLKSLALTGAYNVGIDVAANATALTTLDASGLTGTAGVGIALGANTSTLTVTTTANTDFVTLGSGVVNLNTGAGNDTVTGTAAQVAADTINAGTAGIDTLSLNTIGTLADNTFANTIGFEKLTITDATTTNITSGGFFNSAFASGVTLTAASIGDVASTFDLTSYNQVATVAVTTSAVTAITTVKGGAGADTITVTAGSYTGATNGLIINGGAGADTISFSDIAFGNSGVIVITGGTGADIINHVSTGAQTANIHKVTYSETGINDSTTTAYDQITNFALTTVAGKNSDLIDFSGTATVQADIGATASGIANVNYAIASGSLAFTGTAASGLTLTQKIDIANTAAAVNGAMVAFTDNTNSFVFHQDTTNGDQLVQLVGVAVTGITTDPAAAVATGFVYAV